MSNEELRGVKRMADFIAIYYTKAFLESRLASKTPAGDLKFLHQMNLYRTQDASAAAICVKSILNHLWYLTEELVVFAIFDTDLPATVRKAMVLKLLSIHRPKTFAPQKPIFPKIDPQSIDFPDQLITFVGKRSWLLFHLLGYKEETLDWMYAPVDCWENMSGYTKAETVVRSFAVTNDSAERNVKLMQDFIPMRENVDEQQALFQVVEQYRNKQSEEKNT